MKDDGKKKKKKERLDINIVLKQSKTKMKQSTA